MLREMIKRRFTFVVAILCLTAVSAAQTRPQTPPANPQASDQKGVIQGTVYKAGAGQPLKRARVSLRRQNQPQAQLGLQGDQAAARAAAITDAVNLGVGGGAAANLGAQIQEQIQVAMGAVNTQAVTDDSGRFMFNGVDPGQYRVSVDRDGYIRQEYGQRSLTGPGTIITLNAGQRLNNIDFQMVTAGSISGRVFNEDGEPLAGVQVQAQTYTYQQGRRVLTQTGQTTPTNDLGEFRVYWLSPGDYYVSATARRGIVAAINPVVTQQAAPQRGAAGGRGARGGPGGPGGGPGAAMQMPGQNEETYAPTYFPGTITPESATPLRLTAGAEIRGIDFGLRPTQTVSVRGQVIVPVVAAQNASSTPAPPQGRGAGARGGPGGFGARGGGPQINVVLTRVGAGGRSFGPGGMNRTNVRQDGTFEITNVVPGSYNLAAVARQDGQQSSGRLRIEVGGAGLDNVSLPLRPGIAVSGKIFLDGTPPANFKMSQLRVNLQQAEDFGIGMGGGAANGQVADDGTFTLQNVSPMEYRVRVNGLPQGAYLMAGRIGGDDAVNRPFAINGDQQVTLQLQVGFAAGRVQGTVVDEKGNPYQGVLATLIPDESRRLRTDVYFSSPTDQYGHFNFPNVPPGSYKIFAWEDIPNGAYQDPDYIRAFEDRGRVVKVDAGGSVDTQVPVIRP